MYKRENRFNRKPRPVARDCMFCNNKIEPDYKEIATLNKFITERGKILGRDRTGLCSKHQRRLATAIKRARQVALLPFIVRA